MFFLPKCALCKKTLGMVCRKIGKTERGKDVSICLTCDQIHGPLFDFDKKTGVVTPKKKSEEVRKKCTVCGHVFCFNRDDLVSNQQKRQDAMLSSVASVAGAVSGHYAASAVNAQTADKQLGGIVDYSKCPKCNSREIVTISDDEFNRLSKKSNTTEQSVSSADELKKFKDLLDSGVITQEEFDAKKKQLLGL